MCEDNHLLISQKIHAHNIWSISKTWLGFSLLYLKTKHKTLHVKRAWAELGISTICMTFDRSSLILDRSSQTELHNKFCSNSIPTLHKKQILWASLNKTKTFWSWFANITNWSSNSFKPKVLEPNRCYGFFFFYMRYGFIGLETDEAICFFIVFVWICAFETMNVKASLKC